MLNAKETMTSTLSSIALTNTQYPATANSVPLIGDKAGDSAVGMISIIAISSSVDTVSNLNRTMTMINVHTTTSTPGRATTGTLSPLIATKSQASIQSQLCEKKFTFRL